VDAIQEAREGVDGIVTNPAGFTHSSVAIRDALLATGLPVVEVHLSNLAKREAFRQTSLVSDIAVGTISGFGAIGYQLAVQALHHHLTGGR
jgi:3-dehydroquinate dehydratase II